FWNVLGRLLASPASSMFFPVEAQELWPTLALVFNEYDADSLRKNRKLPEERIRVVGNPELDSAAVRRITPLSPRDRAALAESVGLNPDIPILFYADEGLADSKKFGWNEGFRLQVLEQICEACHKAGVQLLFRPRHSRAAGDAIPLRNRSR